MRLRGPTRREERENMIPLINVVFLLLIFFMLAGRISQTDPFEIEPPRSASERPPAGNPTTVYVGADGQVALGEQVLELAALSEAVAEGRGDGGELRLKTDARAEANRVIAVMEALREAGVERVTLLTARKDE